MSAPLDGRVLLVSGVSDGVGRAILRSAAVAGAEVAVLLRQGVGSDAESRALLGEIEECGRDCLILRADLRRESEVMDVVARVADHYGRLDTIVCNAGSGVADNTLAVEPDVFRAMVEVNLHATYLLGRAALPHLLESGAGQLLSIAPPVDISEERLGSAVPWSVSKFAATLLTLGWAAEFIEERFSANTLWPHRPIHEPGFVPFPARSQSPVFLPSIMGEAAAELLARPAGQVTGRALLDAEVLQASGVADLSTYVWRPRKHLTGAFPQPLRSSDV